MWKSVVGWEGLYEVSDNGDVRSLDRVVEYSNGRKRTHKGRVLRSSVCRGYPTVRLHSQDDGITRYVHQLVLEAFIGPRPEGAECCHNNGVRTDCRLKNLRYGTKESNAQDKYRHGTARGPVSRGAGNIKAKLDEDKVRWVRENDGTRDRHEMAAELGVAYVTIWRAATNRAWTHI